MPAMLLEGKALDRLARRLHETMERLDPAEDDAWDDLPEFRKQFFRGCVREMFYSLRSELERRRQ